MIAGSHERRKHTYGLLDGSAHASRRSRGFFVTGSERPVWRGRHVLLTVLVAAAGSCRFGDRGHDDRSVERSRHGDTLVVHSRAPAHGDTAVLREIARIGAARGRDELLLHDVSAFVESPDGQVVVADASGLRRFSAQGEFLERIARPGKGPGEVEHVVGMDVTADGRLLAVDLGNRRINVYGLDTGELDHWPLPPGMAGSGRQSIVATDEGAVFVAYNPPLPRDGTPIRYPRPIYLELAADGSVRDTIYADARFAAECPTRSSLEWRSGFYEDLRVRYFPKVKWSASRRGVVATGCPVDYRLDLIAADGSVLRISRAWQPVVASEEERDGFVASQTFSRNRSGYFESWSWSGPAPPEERPAYQRIVFGRNGRLWVWPSQPGVRREVPARFQRQGAPSVVYGLASAGAFDVFARSGEYLGAVRLPEDVPYRPFPGRADPFIRGDTLWAIRYDSLDVPYITKYAVQWPNGGEDQNGDGDRR